MKLHIDIPKTNCNRHCHGNAKRRSLDFLNPLVGRMTIPHNLFEYSFFVSGSTLTGLYE
jgi:hypothetical protein